MTAKLLIVLVGAEGFEPPASCSQSRHATRLRHAPNCCFWVDSSSPCGGHRSREVRDPFV